MSIRDFLPKKEKTTAFYVKLPAALVTEVKVAMKEDGFSTWRDFLTACFNSYLESRGEENSKKLPAK